LWNIFGEGAASLAATDRATVANMAPEYGPTAAFFPVDEQTLAYLKAVGRSDHELAVLRAYLEASRCLACPRPASWTTARWW
jgi:aconitate hydratase